MKKILIIGIGSPHGQDRAGWLAVEQLQKRYCALGHGTYHHSLECRIAKVPHELLDWFELNTPTHIIDACQSNTTFIEHFLVSISQGELCLQTALSRESTDRQAEAYNSARFLQNLRSGSTHHLDLPSALLLADRLGMLPLHLMLWTIPVNNVDLGTNDCPVTTQAIADCVDLLTAELISTLN